MRRFLTTLMILLVVLVAGLSALVLLVNPNDFRDYMVCLLYTSPSPRD